MAHPYEPWPRTAPPGGSGEDMNVSPWWDLHPGAGSWMDLTAGPGVGLSGMSQGGSMGLQSALGPYCPDAQLCSLPPPQLGLAPHPHLFPQDGFKMEPLGAPELLQQHQQQQQPQQQQQQLQVYTLEEPQEGATSAPRPKSQRRSGSRASGQAVCRCPNCVHAEQLGGQGGGGGAGEDGRLRKHMHNCHIPGCGKAYAKTSHLKAHLRWHSGDRPFVCNWLFCGKRFTRADELQKHMQSHTGAKKFSCTVCTRVFMRSDHLAKHMRSHDSASGGGGREERANGEGGTLGLPPSPHGAPVIDGAEVPRKLKSEPDPNLDIMPGQAGKLS